MSRRKALIVTDRPAQCGVGREGKFDTEWCSESGVRVYVVEMWSEDIPAMYPPGSEREGRRLISAACPRHLWEWAVELSPGGAQ